MKIISIRIEAFGKLRDFSADFTGGLNCVRRENEFGKSTILSFVRAMFYGFPKRSSKSVREYGRSKYTPWQSGVWGGTLTFSQEGKIYRIERSFSGKKAEDRVSLREEGTGAIRDTGDLEIGEYLFRFGEAEFVNTFFVGQLASSMNMSGRETEPVANRLANLAAAGNEHYSFEAANKNLSAAMTDLKAARGGGRIQQMEKEKEELETRRIKAEETLRQIGEIAAQADEKFRNAEEKEQNEAIPLSMQIKKQEDASDALQKILSGVHEERVRTEERTRALAEMIRKQREDEKKDAERRKRRTERRNELEKEIGELARKKSEKAEEAERAERDIHTMTGHFEARYPEILGAYRTAADESLRLKNEEERCEEESAAFSSDAVKAGDASFRRKIRLPVIFSAVLLSVAVLGYVLSALLRVPEFRLFSFALLPAALPIGWTVICFLRRRAENADFSKRRAEHEEEMSRIRKEYQQALLTEKDTLSESDRYSEKYESDRKAKEREIEFIRERIAEIEARMSQEFEAAEAIREEERREALEADLRQAAANTPENNGAGDPDTERSNYEKRLGDLLGQIKNLTEEADKAKQNLERLRFDENRVRTEIRLLREEASRLRGSAESMASGCPDLSEIEEQIASQADRIKRANDYYRALESASEAMSAAAGEMESLFAPKVNEIAGRYLSELTGERYSALRFDRDFRVEISDRTDGLFYEADYFSAGTVDQVYLALRLAIADWIDTSEDRMPILLDDALVQYDDERAKMAVSVLRELSKTRQIIMFTCHKNIDTLFSGRGRAGKQDRE